MNSMMTAIYNKVSMEERNLFMIVNVYRSVLIFDGMGSEREQHLGTRGKRPEIRKVSTHPTPNTPTPNSNHPTMHPKAHMSNFQYWQRMDPLRTHVYIVNQTLQLSPCLILPSLVVEAHVCPFQPEPFSLGPRCGQLRAEEG